MSNLKISELNNITAISGSYTFPASDTNSTYKISFEQLSDWVNQKEIKTYFKNYTLNIINNKAIITFNNTEPVVFTIPNSSNFLIPVGTAIDIIRLGSGIVTVTGDSNVIINSSFGWTLRNIYSKATITKINNNTWVVSGDLALSSTPTPTPSQTPTITPTPSQTPTITPTISITPSNTTTPTPTPTETPTNTPTPTITPTPTPTPLPGLYAFGDNSEGQLGLGDSNYRQYPTLVDNNYNWHKISSGGNGQSINIGAVYPYTNQHTLGINSFGQMYSWGYNNYGVLGQGDNIPTNIPKIIGSYSNWTDIATGQDHSLAVNSLGELYAWGANSFGQLGDSTNTDKYSPTKIGNNTNWTKVFCHSNGSFAINSSGELYAWGRNDRGQLGLPISGSYDIPTKVGNDTWATISAGYWGATGINTSGELYSWGLNAAGSLGIGEVNICNNLITCPVVGITKVGSNNNWIDVSRSMLDFHVLALNSSGEVYSWGRNAYGELGVGDNTTKWYPEKVVGSWSNISASTFGSFAINSAGEAYAWGLGFSNLPTKFTTGNNWKKVFSAFRNSYFMIFGVVTPVQTPSPTPTITPTPTI